MAKTAGAGWMREENLIEHMLALECELLSTQARHSERRLGELLAEEFVEFGASGRIYDKQSIIDSLIQTESTESFEIDDFRLVTSGENIAFVAYSCTAKSEAGKIIRESNRSSLWKLTSGHWQMIFHQGTRTK